MRRWKSYTHLLGMTAASILCAGLALAVFPPTNGIEDHFESAKVLGAEDAPESKASDLSSALRNADVSGVRKLIENGADVNARDDGGNTPLILAALYSTPECVKLLIDKGADVNADNKAGVTALVRGATNHQTARLLVDAGANVNARTAIGNTPLILAARKAGNSQTVKLLLERGANVGDRNRPGASAMLSAAASGDIETMRILLNAGAQANDVAQPKNPHDFDFSVGFRTPLMWAAYHNDLPTMRLLLDHKADPNQATLFGSPLSHACWRDSVKAVELLIERGANVNGRDAVANFTPLHWAAATELPDPQLVKLLLAKGADPNAVGGEPVGAYVLTPQTPRLIAERRGQTAIVAALVAAGAKESPATEMPAMQKNKVSDKLDHATVIAAAEKALARLQMTAAKSREAFLQHASKQDCASCHQQYLPMAAVGSARNHAIRIDDRAAHEQLESLKKINNPFFEYENTIQALFHPEPAHSFGYHLFALAQEASPPNRMTDGLVHHLVTIQSAAGNWVNLAPRPPMTVSDVSATALAVQAIKRYGWKGRQEEFAESVDRARQWLWKFKAQTNEDAVFQLLGLHWAGEPAEKLAELGKSLLQQQREDGGWAQLPKLPSDAYATGEVLYTLVQTVKHSVDSPEWQRGLRFLLERQQPDGTWHTVRRAFPFQPTMPSGFPYHRDAWVSTAATSWAVMAMTRSLPMGSSENRPLSAEYMAVVEAPGHQPRIDFAQQIKPLLERSCVSCHSGERARANLRVDSRESILQGGQSGVALIVPGKSRKSPLIDYINDQMPEAEMPPKAVRKRIPALTAEEVQLVRAWIDQGAEWPTGITVSSSENDKSK